MSHTCSAYCVGTVHCIQVLAQPCWTAEAIAADHAARYRVTVLRVTPAREADVAAWQRQEGWDYPVTPDKSVVWLLFADYPRETPAPGWSAPDA